MRASERKIEVFRRSAIDRAGQRPGCTCGWRSTEPNGDLSTRVGDFDRVVICGGGGSRRLAANLGDRVNVYPVRGYSITVHLPESSDQEAAPRTSLLDDRAKNCHQSAGRYPLSSRKDGRVQRRQQGYPGGAC
ncbi:FAD-dependent oxidoreductase [Bradyrhizobium tropiciagri]|uniref:FAD-dependent oxidoreductase n=1 Tax=Bradyrhizobium tropiciagri TaxID=312253 RepID=UPI003D311A5C